MYTYENARRGKKKKAYSAKQLAAHAVSRQAFERAKAIRHYEELHKNCDHPYMGPK